MEKQTGDPRFPIWLIGDSEPERWYKVLKTPLDPRHPARHSIWTPILDCLQDDLFRQKRLRLNTRPLFIRNAVANSAEKPSKTEIDWSNALNNYVGLLGDDLQSNKPRLVLTFGSFACEFTRRACGLGNQAYGKWDTKTLGNQFRNALENFDNTPITILPLLHASIARRAFMTAHAGFVGAIGGESPNYFEYVGAELYKLLSSKLADSNIWITEN